MSCDHNLLPGRSQFKACVIPVNVSASACEAVFLFPLGCLDAPLSEFDMDKVRDFLNDNLGLSDVAFEGGGDASDDALLHLDSSCAIDYQLNLLRNFVRDNAVSPAELRRMIDLAIGFYALDRVFVEKKAA